MNDIWNNSNTRYVEFYHCDTPLTATITTSKAEPANDIPKEMEIHAITVNGINPEPNIIDLIPMRELDIMEEEIWNELNLEYEGRE